MAEELEQLAIALGQRLVARGLRVATAESCTGGLVAAAITAIAGSSQWFERGFITYSNEAKIEVLGVPQATLDEFGSVSEETARALALGALERSLADVSVAVTGIAGPAGGSPGKPVGMVCFGWAVQSTATTTATRHFSGGREAVRQASVVAALEGMISRL
ncbi:MAG: CinA family protein [Casimicrobiaceae bacterium]